MKWKCKFLIFISLLILNGNVFAQTFSVNSIQDASSALRFTKTVDPASGAVTLALTIQSAGAVTSTDVLSVTMQSGTQGFTVADITGAVDDGSTVVTTILSFDPNTEGLKQDRLLVQFTDGTISIPIIGYGSNVLFGDTNGDTILDALDVSDDLKDVVGKITLSTAAIERADVTGVAGVTAFDASLKLQVFVGLIDQVDFPVVSSNFPAKAAVIAAEVYIDKNNVRDSDEDLVVPIYIKAEGVFAMNGDIRFDPLYLQYDGLYVSGQEIMTNTFLEDNVVDNVVRIAMARLTSIDLDGDVLFLRFKKVRKDQLGGTITIERFYVNESLAEVSGFNLESKPILPFEFFIAQNYPNPFNNSTVIRYGLPTESIVSLKIFNHLGQEITTLVNGNQPAGNYSVTWDGRNAAGISVASGVYFYVFQTPGFRNIKRLVFVK